MTAAHTGDLAHMGQAVDDARYVLVAVGIDYETEQPWCEYPLLDDANWTPPWFVRYVPFDVAEIGRASCRERV